VFEKQPVAAQSLKDSTTGRLLEEILLLSIELQSNEDAKSLLAGLNEVMMDTLHSANPNHCFTSLIRFLYEGANLSGERVATPEFVDNALRALLEMARSMQECMGKLDVDMLLYDCHMFLVSHPPSKYRGKEFRPLRLLKTILNELVKIKGGGIRDHLTLVPVETKPTLCSYIELVLQQHLSSQSRAAGDKSDSKLDIASIFDKIGSKEKDVAKEVFLSCIVMRGWETRGCVAGAFMPHNPPRSLSMLLVVFR
jgi:cytoskeleton-associated protein 5